MNCVFCDQNELKPTLFENTIFNQKLFEYIRCTNCGLIQVNPLPNDEDYQAMYSMSYYSGTVFEPSPEFDYIFDEIGDNQKTFVDFGCGGGRVLASAIAKGYDVTGTDIGEKLIAEIRPIYSKARFIEMNDFYADITTYDVIFVSNVFEHLTNPNEVMCILASKLNSQGRIIVEGPIENNFTLAGLFRKLMFGLRKYAFQTHVTHAPVHIFYANASNQKRMFEKSGLKTLKYNLSEGEWPFPRFWSDVKGLKDIVFYVIAKISRFLGMFIPRSGNMFFYVGEKN